MERLPFDPSRMASPSSRPVAPPRSGDAPLTISQLASRVSGALSAGLAEPVRVTGEISGFRDRTHWYFDLKDELAVINAVMFASAARRAGFTPANGQQVTARGRIEFYAKAGKITLIVDRLQPVGEGALDQRLKALVEELRALGYLSPERKRPLPAFPRRVAVITSASGAALQDVLATMRQRCPAVDVLVVDVRVQGEGAAPDIARAIRDVSRRASRLGVDALMLTRGGGSMEDLWAFNERIVADAIFEAAVPVIAAVGHETDVTIAELVADDRGATPTQAAMRLTPDRSALVRQVQSLHERLHASAASLRADSADLCADAFRELRLALQRRLHTCAQHVTHAAWRLETQQPRAIHLRLFERLARAERSLKHAMHTATAAPDLPALQLALARAWAVRRDRLHASVASLERQLHAMAPRRVLERGYSLTRLPDGRFVRAVRDVRPGDTLTTILADGEFRSEVSANGARLTPPLRHPRRASSPSPPGLFD